jgi:hypothetical protein
MNKKNSLKGKKKIGQEGWILKWAIIFIAVIIILSYFGFDFEKLMTSDSTTSNLDYIKDSLYNLWTNYVKEYADLIYQHTRLIIDPTLDALKNPGSLQNNFSNFNTNLPTIR